MALFLFGFWSTEQNRIGSLLEWEILCVISVSVLNGPFISFLTVITYQNLPVPVLQLPCGQDDGGEDVLEAAVLGHDVNVADEAGQEEAEHNLLLVCLSSVLQLHEIGHVDEDNLGTREGDDDWK